MIPVAAPAAPAAPAATAAALSPALPAPTIGGVAARPASPAAWLAGLSAPAGGEDAGRLMWRALGACVRGASHVRRGLPNQDALRWTGSAGTRVLAVSDGHGSARCFRSDTGSRLAVATATRVLTETLARLDDAAGGELALVAAATQRIVREWTVAVSADLRLFPFTHAELRRLLAEAGDAGRAAVLARPLLAYGATLCAVAASPRGLLCVQLGDGDIVAVSRTGDAYRPLPPDARLLGDQTTSLCAPRAADDFRVAYQRFSGRASDAAPSLVLVSTDGYANSFRDEAGFLQVGPDLLAAVRESGLPAVSEALPGWLADASRLGSGDDVTLGLLVAAQAPSPRRWAGGRRGAAEAAGSVATARGATVGAGDRE